MTTDPLERLRTAYHEADAIYIEDTEDVARFDELMEAIEGVLEMRGDQ